MEKTIQIQAGDIIKIIESDDYNKKINEIISQNDNWKNEIYVNFQITENTLFKKCNLLSIILKYKKLNDISSSLIQKYFVNAIN